MQIVPGSTVDEHYWALSYAWHQTGEIIEKGDSEFERIDNGNHEIISYESQSLTEQEDWQGKRRIVSEIDPESKKIHHAKFEGVLQQICKDFDIRYIFYDQMCIDQNDHDEKMRDIKHMHLFYENAYCTLALVPELEHKDSAFHKNSPADIDGLVHSQWSTRAWTLFEAYVSKNLLFVGRNVHFWSNAIARVYTPSKAEDFIRDICNNKKRWRASTAVWHARSRRSSSTYDRIFSLANMFPELKEDVTFSYNQSIVDLMVDFFGLLVQKDLTILLFGAPLDPLMDSNMAASHINEANLLPSWTGHTGIHIPDDPVLGNSIQADVSECCIDGKFLHLNCAYITVRIEKTSTIERSTNPEDPFDYTADGLPRNFLREDENYTEPSISGRGFLTFVSTTNESQEAHNTYTEEYRLRATHILPVKEGCGSWVNTLSLPTHVGAYLSLTEECSECFVLSGIPFDLLYDVIAMPVVRKGPESYKMIGACFIDCSATFDSALQARKDFVIE
ncbi:hypothetical protein BJV82DRAFT_263335 [Fennellomyces sp. T-0311]|nr:hypothetical protein BJV82DRAFT_263335 [Fennellomyces sp. T-0311]